MRGIEWVPLSTGTKAVPQPVATPLVWFAAFTSALLLVAITNGLGGHGHPNTALIVLSLLSGLLGLHARITAAPGTALLCWLHLNGFAIPPAGQLTWAEHRDTTWLACLLGATVAGTVIARIVNARAAYRRLT